MGMRPNDWKTFLRASLTKNPKRAIFLYGGVGVGKSMCTKQVVDELGWEFRDIRLSLLDATDLRGLPAIDKEKRETIWTKPVFLPPEDYDKDLVIFFDEFSNCSSSIQNACLQLVLDRKIGEYSLPPKTRIVCAGNLLKDGAYVFKLSSALNNRFINIEYEIDFDDWKEWAYKEKINPIVIGFLNFRRELLQNYKNDVDNKSFASPRSWGYISELMSLGIGDGILYEAIKGAVGEGAGTEFYGFLKVYRDLPNPEDIILKDKNLVPEESNQKYALISALINVTRKHTDKVGRLIKYSMLKKMGKEFSVLLIKDALKTELKDKIIGNKEFDVWVKENRDVILE